MPKGKVRLDRWLVDAGLTTSRERARALILEGRVEVSGCRRDKPGTLIHPDEPVEVKGPGHPYVSRGGVKLEGALRAFGLSVEGRVALDVGASTGGFTHCLLLHGARRVYALDVGYGQLAWSLRTDPRVVVLERTNVRHVAPETFPEPMDLVTVDASFISLKKVVPALVPLLRDGGDLVCLIKPQFEVGKGRVGKGGVVRDPALHREVVAGVEAFVRSLNLEVSGTSESPLEGPSGNNEFFLHARTSWRREGEE